MKNVYLGSIAVRTKSRDVLHHYHYLPEPCEEVWRGGDQVDGVHGVSDHLGDGPGEQQQGEAQGELRGRQHVQDQPGHIHSEIELFF